MLFYFFLPALINSLLVELGLFVVCVLRSEFLGVMNYGVCLRCSVSLSYLFILFNHVVNCDGFYDLGHDLPSFIRPVLYPFLGSLEYYLFHSSRFFYLLSFSVDHGRELL